jgi:hypothetical protein
MGLRQNTWKFDETEEREVQEEPVLTGIINVTSEIAQRR